MFLINITARVLSYIFFNDFISLKNYHEYSLLNWIQLSGSAAFFFMAKSALKKNSWSVNSKTVLSLAFVLFVLLISYNVSYIYSLFNTKNTLTLFFIGIVTVSLFFYIEYKHIIKISAFITLYFICSIIFKDLPFSEKLINIITALILGFTLFCFSRYSYYFKSRHFVKLKELEEKNHEIELLNIEKSEILAFVAHDLRNPLNNIEGISALLDNEENADVAAMILKSTSNAKKIIDDLIETEKTEQNITQTNIVDFIKEDIERWQVNSSRKIVFKNSCNENVYVAINPVKFSRVLDNLISNGIKFSKRNTPIEVFLAQKDSIVRITVKDYGIGIPLHLQSLLFNSFSKAGRTGLNGEKSTGLGLHISKKIIEQHKGSLSLLSKENEGTSFIIELPVIGNEKNDTNIYFEKEILV